MRKSFAIFLILLITAFILVGVFIGSMTGQAIRGEINSISSAEATIFLVFFLLITQVIIVLFIKLRKEKSVNIQEVLQETT